ncbi:MAG: dTMP kinase [Clostridia bacterium]|nr:dTMP kinase [Clostridia bacterium]
MEKLKLASENRGRFIVMEGIDGSGKTTQIKMLAKKLAECGRKTYITAEPTQSVTGGLLRDALCGYTKRTACELAALFVIDRINHNVNPANGIKKLLLDGFDVICDRYYYSSLAYQGSETDFDWVKRMNIDCPEIMTPDICIFLDASPDLCIERISGERAVVEIYEKKATLERFRERYFQVFDMLKDTDNIAVVSSESSAEATADRVFAAVKTIL